MSVIRVGAHVPREILVKASPEAVPPSEARNTKYIQDFLDSVRLDNFFGQYSNDSEYDMRGWSWDNVDDKWVKTKKDSSIIKRGKWFDPRVAEVVSRDGNRIVEYGMVKKIGEGSFGLTVLYKNIKNVPVDENNNIFESFIMKIPTFGDSNKHEALVIETLKRQGAFSDIMCASVRQPRLYDDGKSIILLETFDGDLSFFNKKLDIEQAFKVAYAVYQECATIYRITEPMHLIHEDLKLENVLYSNKYRPRRGADDCFTVCVADFGGFVPKGSRRGTSTYNAAVANARGYVADERHFSFCLGAMILNMLSSSKEQGVDLHNIRFLENDDDDDLSEADDFAAHVETFINQSMNETYQKALLQIIGIRNGKFIDTINDDVTNTFDKIGKIFRNVFISQRVFYRPVSIESSGLVRKHYSEAYDSENEDDEDSADDPDFKGPERIIPDIKKVFRPWDPDYGYHSFESAINAIEKDPPYRSKCRCECNCMRYRMYKEEWRVVGPSNERLYDHWAVRNRQNVWFVTCAECAMNFEGDDDDSSHICTGTGADWPRSALGKCVPLRDWSSTQAENFIMLQGIVFPSLDGMSGMDLINKTKDFSRSSTIKKRIQDFSKLEE
jgi:hypothetical protein